MSRIQHLLYQANTSAFKHIERNTPKHLYKKTTALEEIDDPHQQANLFVLYRWALPLISAFSVSATNAAFQLAGLS